MKDASRLVTILHVLILFVVLCAVFVTGDPWLLLLGAYSIFHLSVMIWSRAHRSLKPPAEIVLRAEYVVGPPGGESLVFRRSTGNISGEPLYEEVTPRSVKTVADVEAAVSEMGMAVDPSSVTPQRAVIVFCSAENPEICIEVWLDCYKKGRQRYTIILQASDDEYPGEMVRNMQEFQKREPVMSLLIDFLNNKLPNTEKWQQLY